MDIFGSILVCTPQKGFLNLVLRKGKVFLKHTGLFTQRCMLQDLTGVNTRQISYPMLEQIMLSIPPGSSLCLQKQGYLAWGGPLLQTPLQAQKSLWFAIPVLSPSLLSSLLLSLGGMEILEEKVGEMPPTPSVPWVKIVTSSPINSINLPIHSLSCFQVPVESYLSLSFVPCMESRPKFVKYNVGITLSIDYSWEKQFLLYFQYQGIMWHQL